MKKLTIAIWLLATAAAADGLTDGCALELASLDEAEVWGSECPADLSAVLTADCLDEVLDVLDEPGPDTESCAEEECMRACNDAFAQDVFNCHIAHCQLPNPGCDDEAYDECFQEAVNRYNDCWPTCLCKWWNPFCW